MSSESQFSFLRPEWPTLFEATARVEATVNADPRAACVYARQALETLVRWMFDFDSDFKRPFDRSLASLLSAPTFRQFVPEKIVGKTNVIREYGNKGAHATQTVSTRDAIATTEELFHVAYWFGRQYAKDWRGEGATFDPKKLPPSPAEAARQTVAQLQALQTTLDARDKQLAAERAERLAESEKLSAELAQAQAELKAAKAAASLKPDPHDYSEAQTRDRFIDLLLREAGWGTSGWTTGHDVEHAVTGMPGGGRGFVDYVLWGDDGKPLAVVEAKRTTKDANVGQQQAKLYADALEQKHGRRPVIFCTNGYETYLWDDAGRYPPRRVQGFLKKDELELMIQRRTTRRDLASERIDGSIVERDYQTRAIRAVGARFEQRHRRALLTMATGTGKTRTAIALVDVMMRANWAKRVLFLADRQALVKQTEGAFKKHFPESAPVNLLTEKAKESRVYVSTYQTMMGLIESGRFGVGHFDLIVIDEAHRSVYQKYRAIFAHFDAMLLGLTATPRTEVDRDTYGLFELAANTPTDAYDLDDAIRERHLVPFNGVSVPLKFQREGIRYDELSADEQARWDELEWDEEGGVPGSVDAGAINAWLFNVDTVDKVLAHLMQNGIKVAGGDRLGKTIIFAKNKDHADFICKRFDANYPQLAGTFARQITHELSNAQTLIDDFSEAAKDPHVAVSVDMLDTGIDVPEVVNLVFFKLVRSKTKFWQMIGRGTRLSEDLFGPGKDKERFLIFDFCQNFEFFNQNPNGIEGNAQRPLSAHLLSNRLALFEALKDAKEEPLVTLRSDLGDTMYAFVAAMNVENFLVRPHRRIVEALNDRARWDALTDDEKQQIDETVGTLPTQLPTEDELAKRFDLTLLKLQLAVIGHAKAFEALRDQVKEIAQKLTEKTGVPMVAAQMPLLLELGASEWWEGVTLPMLEDVRRRLRELVKFIDKGERVIVYTNFDDVIGEGVTVALPPNLHGAVVIAEYKRKLQAWLKTHEDDGPIRRLRTNQPLTAADLRQLDAMLFESAELGDRRTFEAAYGRQPDLPTFVRSIVGMDPAAARAAFGRFLLASTYGATQIQFVNTIIDYLTLHGTIDVKRLYESPFRDMNPAGVDGLFSKPDADAIVQILAGLSPQDQAFRTMNR